MSKGNFVYQVRVDAEMREAFKDALKKRNEHSRGASWTISDWIRSAIAEKLAKAKRSATGKRVRKYTCAKCGDKVTMQEIAYHVKPLFGPVEYTCNLCSRITLNDQQLPLGTIANGNEEAF